MDVNQGNSNGFGAFQARFRLNSIGYKMRLVHIQANGPQELVLYLSKERNSFSWCGKLFASYHGSGSSLNWEVSS